MIYLKEMRAAGGPQTIPTGALQMPMNRIYLDVEARLQIILILALRKVCRKGKD